jgi:hypothetical protein
MRHVCSPSCSAIKQVRQEVVSQVDQGAGRYEGFTRTCPGGKTNLARFSGGKPYELDN